MKYCINCGKPLPNDSKFCNDCEQKVFRRIFCINCGTELKEEQKFCTNCGFSAVSSQKANETLQQPNDKEFNKPIPVQEGIEQPQTERQSAEGDTEKKHQIETAACQNEDNNSSENESPNAPTKSLVLLWCYAIGGFILFGLGLWLIIMDVFDLSVVDFDSKKQSKMLAKALIGIVAGGVITVRYIREICKYKNLNDKNIYTIKEDSDQVKQKKSSKLPLIIILTILLLGGGFLAYLFWPIYQEDNTYVTEYVDCYDNSETSSINDSDAIVSVQDSPTWDSDRGLFQVQGPVKKISGYLDANVTELIIGSFVEFDENGKCINLSSSSFRDDNGFINNQNSPGSSFKFNEQGFLSSYDITGCNCFTTCKYEYNNHNLLVNCREISYGHYFDFEKGEHVQTEEILSSYSFHNHIVDHHGNWIVRIALNDSSGYNNFAIHKRNIEYWDGTKSGFKPSSDLAFFDVKGPVKTIEEMYINKLKPDGSVYTFNDKGICINLPKEYTRKDNHITGYSFTEYYGEYSETYEYNDKGLIKTSTKHAIGSSISTFEYDSDGMLIIENSITEGSEEGENYCFDEKFTYKYITFDEYGNWTERERICSYVGETGGYHNVGDTEIQIRTITYY